MSKTDKTITEKLTEATKPNDSAITRTTNAIDNQVNQASQAIEQGIEQGTVIPVQEYIPSEVKETIDEEVPPHKHLMRDLRDGFKVYTSVPTHPAPTGTMLFYENGATRAIYVRINQGWFSASVA